MNYGDLICCSFVVIVFGTLITWLGISIFTSLDGSNGIAGQFYAGIMIIIAGLLGILFSGSKKSRKFTTIFSFITVLVIVVAVILEIVALVRVAQVDESIYAQEVTSNHPFGDQKCVADIVDKVFSANDCMCDLKTDIKVYKCEIITMANGHSCDEITGTLVSKLTGSLVLLMLSAFVVVIYAFLVKELRHRHVDVCDHSFARSEAFRSTAARTTTSSTRRVAVSPVAIAVPYNQAITTRQSTRQPSSTTATVRQYSGQQFFLEQPTTTPRITTTTTTTRTTENTIRDITTVVTTVAASNALVPVRRDTKWNYSNVGV